MLDALFGNLLILAAEEPAGDAPPAGGLMGTPLIMLVGFVLLFYFLLLRPQNKERAKRMAMIQALKRNDRVLTVGGIYGVVTDVDRGADTITLRIDESTNAKMRVSLGAISRVLGDEPDKGGAAK